jgi:hypothetical protein
MSLLLLLILLAPFAGSQVPQLSGDQDLLPPDGFLGQWKKAERSRIFTSGDLYGRIDGGAELFLEFGFERLTVQTYLPMTPAVDEETRGSEFQLEIYRMSDPVAAAGVYLMKCGRETRAAGFDERHAINSYQLIFFRNRYYVVVNNMSGDEKLRGGMVEFARFTASRLPESRRDDFAEALPAGGIIRDSIRLARGPYALQAVYTLGEGDILQLHGSITAVAAEYEGNSGRKTIILVDYPDKVAAGAAFRHVLSNLDDNLRIEEKSAGRFAFKDYAGEYGLVSLSGRRLTAEVRLTHKPILH